MHYAVAHEDFVWDIRTEPGVVNAFATVYGTEDLIASFDSINITFPRRTDIEANTRWAHQDQDPKRPGFRCLQGIVNLAPNGPNDGGLIVMKGAHTLSEEYHEAFKDEEPVWAWTNEWYGYRDTGIAWLEAKGFKFEKLCAEPGDLFICKRGTLFFLESDFLTREASQGTAAFLTTTSLRRGTRLALLLMSAMVQQAQQRRKNSFRRSRLTTATSDLLTGLKCFSQTCCLACARMAHPVPTSGLNLSTPEYLMNIASDTLAYPSFARQLDYLFLLCFFCPCHLVSALVRSLSLKKCYISEWSSHQTH